MSDIVFIVEEYDKDHLQKVKFIQTPINSATIILSYRVYVNFREIVELFYVNTFYENSTIKLSIR